MSSSKDILNDVLTDLGPLGSFGVMFLASNGEILHGSFTNEEHESLAVDIVSYLVLKPRGFLLQRQTRSP